MKAKVRFGILGAFVALAGALGVAGSDRLVTPVSAQIPAGLQVTKNCAATNIQINGTTTCTVTITATANTNVTEPITVTVGPGNTSGTGANPEFGRVRLLNGTSGATGPDVDSVQVNNPQNGLTQSIVVGCFGTNVVGGAGACNFLAGESFVITESIQGVVGGSTVQSITFGAGNAVSLTPTVTVAAATVTATATCTPATVVAGAAPAAAGVSSCVIDLDDNDLFPELVASGNITVTVIGPAGVVLTSTGSTTGSFACGATQNAPQSCDGITVGLSSTTAGVSGNVTLQVNYISDVPAVDFSNVFTLNNVLAVSAVGPVAAFVQPAGLRIACQTELAAPFVTPTPGQLGAVNVIAVGVLPSALVCTVSGVDANNQALAAFAPGTIEVSSLNGAILDASGRLTTNLRIGCDAGGTTTVTIGQGINPNTCTGVTFGVAGVGVGFVELRARYEPSNIAAAAGIQEREATARVGFVAPAVVPNLLLNPNPVVVGQTGTATVRFNRTANCAAAAGVASVQGGTVCVDPTTGLPIFFNLGSALNGNVLLTIDNTAAAIWAEAVSPQNVASPASTGFTATASQVIRRCGFFPTTGRPAGSLSDFFGGCESVSAQYRGVNIGTANISATFIADLPGAFGASPTQTGLSGPVNALLGLFGTTGFNTTQRVLQVVAAPLSGAVQLSRGCNNVSPTVSESATAYAARVTPAGALVAIWEHQSATNTFRGFSPQAGAPNDLSAITRLRPVFVCVNAAATLDQPPA